MVSVTNTPARPNGGGDVPRIGVFDSGVGGLSVLRELRRALPSAELLYVADSGHAPYGERSDAFITERSLAIARFLRAQDAQILVIACNTATAAAVAAVRAAYAGWPVIGVEPGLKPAAALTRRGRVGVMATHGTLRSQRFAALVAQYASGIEVIVQACTGLARSIESGDGHCAPTRALVAEHTAPLLAAQVDVVVLGCTHYPLVAPLIQTAVGPAVTLVDTSAAVAQRAVSQLALTAAPERPARAAWTHLWTSGPVEQAERVAHRWLEGPCTVSALPTAAGGA